MTTRPFGVLLVIALALTAIAFLVPPYAIDVVSATPGFGGAGDPLLMLGAPRGEGPGLGSFHVWQMGAGGTAVLELAEEAVNGPGTDLVVYENPFLVTGTLVDTWVEAVFVEVSTDGASWARFPTLYTGDAGPFGTFEPSQLDWYRGFAGVNPVSANPSAGVDPMDVVAGGGDAFDFADLLDHPQVLAGAVDLQRIRHVRLVDVVGGAATDSQGSVIWDCGDPQFSGADIDAVAVLNSAGNQFDSRPRVDLTYQDQVLALTIEDENGINDFKWGITCSWNGVELDFYTQLLPAMLLLEASPGRVVLVAGPIPQDVPQVEFRFAVRDNSGQVGGDALAVP